MAQEEFFNNCRDYFSRTQLSWDTYFSKWEVMAQEEIVDDLGKDYLTTQYTKFKRIPCRTLKKRLTTVRKLNKKSVNMKNNMHGSKIRRKRNVKRKKVQFKICDEKRENEIIHKTENQTNLECEVVNNKHFESDLKAIFIEILSENTNKLGMFSVLSRMFSGNENTISNFSLGSLIMEKNEFSINPVGKTILHSAPDNEFRHTDCCPRRLARNGSQRGNTSMQLNESPRVVSFRGESRLHTCSRNLQFLMNSYIKLPTILSYEPNCFRTINDGQGNPGSCDLIQACRPLANVRRNHLRCLDDGKTAHASSLCDGDSLRTINRQPTASFYADNGCSSRSSPDAILRKILSPSIGVSSEPPKNCHQKRKKKINRILRDSDDDSGDEKNSGNIESSPGRFLKIFCTPKRPRRSIKFEKTNSDTVIKDPDSEDCFDIVDRVKNSEI